MTARSIGACIFLLVAIFTAGSAVHGQLINSWEGSLEDWVNMDPGGVTDATLANTSGTPNAGIGVTEGSDSLEVTMPGSATAPEDGGWYFRWGQRAISASPDLDALTTAAANPLTHRLEFDVTYETSQIPEGNVTSITQQIAIQANGWSQIDLFADTTDWATDETRTYYAPLFRLDSLTPTSESVQILLAMIGESDSGADMPISVFYDNLRISPIVPDLNGNMMVDVDDWGIFIGNHLTDEITGTAQERFLLGDLDSDGDNDFDDLRVFEAAYDMANGAGSFANDIFNIPEPGSLALLLLGAVGVIAAARRRRTVLMVALAVIACLPANRATAQVNVTLLDSWEDGLGNWNAFNDLAALDVSTIGATDGVQSLAITQLEDGFNWNAQATWGNGSDQFAAWDNAVSIGLSNFTLDFDVTFDVDSVPPFFSFVNVSTALNSQAGWVQSDNVAQWQDIFVTEQVHVSIPLNDGDVPPGGSTWGYQLNIGFNGDWGLDPATVFVDNLTLVQQTEPAVLTLEVDRSTGVGTVKNDEGGSIDFNYYTVSSPEGSLDDEGWLSLDEQNIDAVDLDMSGTAGDALLEGWDAAGGSTTAELGEAFLLGHSTLAAGESFTLGNLYNNRMNAEDLQFQYRNLTKPERLQTGTIAYVGEPPVPDGDFNGDGNWDCMDINALTAAIADESTNLAFDMNGDGEIDIVDVTDPETGWLAVGGANNPDDTGGNAFLSGDADLDGDVDVSDFNEWNTNKFTEVAEWCAGDFTANGFVDVSDFNTWNGNKFSSARDGVSSVPEPGTMLLLVVGLAGGVALRRKWGWGSFLFE